MGGRMTEGVAEEKEIMMVVIYIMLLEAILIPLVRNGQDRLSCACNKYTKYISWKLSDTRRSSWASGTLQGIVLFVHFACLVTLCKVFALAPLWVVVDPCCCI